MTKGNKMMHQLTVTDKELSYILMALGLQKASANSEGNVFLGHEVSSVMQSIRDQIRIAYAEKQ